MHFSTPIACFFSLAMVALARPHLTSLTNVDTVRPSTRIYRSRLAHRTYAAKTSVLFVTMCASWAEICVTFTNATVTVL